MPFTCTFLSFDGTLKKVPHKSIDELLICKPDWRSEFLIVVLGLLYNVVRFMCRFLCIFPALRAIPGLNVRLVAPAQTTSRAI
jgi:hypothetical protein